MKIPDIVRRYLDGKTQKIMSRCKPDFQIGGSENPYLQRWWLIPRNRFFNIYLHRVLRDDDDRALHDHPWASLSICVRGRLREHLKGGDSRFVDAGRVVYRSACFAHRLELYDKFAVTIFITGPRVREWGFHCPKESPAGGWRHWKEFTSSADVGEVGLVCE